jgi:hypothetical protein
VEEIQDSVRSENLGRYIYSSPGARESLALVRLWVDQALTLEHRVEEILRTLADELGWTIETEVESPVGTIDFGVATGTERIAFEVSSGDEGRSADRLRRAAGHLGITRAAVVVADQPAGAYGPRSVPPVDQFPAVIEVQDLKPWLRAAAGIE